MDIIYLPISENFTADDQVLMRFLSQRRAESIRKFRRSSDRKTSLYATLLVIMYLRLHCDIPTGRLRFERTPDGKPCAPGLPVRFSCSHTDGAVLAAFSVLGETGCDIELIADPPYQISSIAFSQNECTALNRCTSEGGEPVSDTFPALSQEFSTGEVPAADRISFPGISISPGENRALTFYTIWTRKEAYLKYLGTGLSGDITRTDVCSPDISRRFISRHIGNHMCSVFNGTGEPVNFTAMDEPDVRSFFLD